MAFLSEIDIDNLKKLSKQRQIRSVKRRYIKQGFNQPFTFYGAMRQDEKGLPFGVRVDVLCNTTLTQDLIYFLYRFFYLSKPTDKYSIWLYNHKIRGLSNVYRERRTNN